MSTVRKSITFTEKQDRFIKKQIENGDFTNDSEYIRDLVRKDQSDHKKLQELRDAIQEGLDSGVSEKSVSDIKAEVKDKLIQNGEL